MGIEEEEEVQEILSQEIKLEEGTFIFRGVQSDRFEQLMDLLLSEGNGSGD